MFDIRVRAFLALEYTMLFFALYYMGTHHPWSIAVVLALVVYIHVKYFKKDVALALLPNYVLFGAIVAMAIVSGKRSWDVFNVYALGRTRKGVRQEMYKNVLGVVGLGLSAYLLV